MRLRGKSSTGRRVSGVAMSIAVALAGLGLSQMASAQTGGYSIGNLLWSDANNNGRVDPGERGIPGVPIALVVGETGIQRITTAYDGSYRFDGVDAGSDYFVCVGGSASRVRIGWTGSNGSGSLVPGQSDATAPSANDGVDNDDNGFDRFSRTCAGPITVDDAHPAINSVDIGQFAYYPAYDWLDDSVVAYGDFRPGGSVGCVVNGPADEQPSDLYLGGGLDNRIDPASHQFQAGEEVKCYRAGSGNSDPITIAAAPVAPATIAEVIETVVYDSSDPTGRGVGLTRTCAANVSGSAEVLYRWIRSGQQRTLDYETRVIALGPTLRVPNYETYDFAYTCQAFAVNAAGRTFRATTRVDGDSFTAQPPVISGAPEPGQTLTCTPALFLATVNVFRNQILWMTVPSGTALTDVLPSASGQPNSLLRKWSNLEPGAPEPSFTLTEAERGLDVYCVQHGFLAVPSHLVSVKVSVPNPNGSVSGGVTGLSVGQEFQGDATRYTSVAVARGYVVASSDVEVGIVVDGMAPVPVNLTETVNGFTSFSGTAPLPRVAHVCVVGRRISTGVSITLGCEVLYPFAQGSVTSTEFGESVATVHGTVKIEGFDSLVQIHLVSLDRNFATLEEVFAYADLAGQFSIAVPISSETATLYVYGVSEGKEGLLARVPVGPPTTTTSPGTTTTVPPPPPTLPPTTVVPTTVPTPTVPPPTGGYSIGDRVWSDANNNGFLDLNEIGVAGVTLRLLRDGDDTGLRSTTDFSGHYAFSGLGASDGYQVCFGPPEPYNPSTGAGEGATDFSDTSAADPNNYLDNDDNGRMVSGQQCSGYIILSDRLPSNQRVDFGLFPKRITLTGFSIGNRVWSDTNNDGLVQPDEPGVANITMHLLRDGVDTGVTARTDASGAYIFIGHPASDGYQVCFDVPAGYAGSNAQGSAGIGGTDSFAPDPNNYLDNDDNGRTVGSQQCSGYIIVNGQLPFNPRVDFGLVPIAAGGGGGGTGGGGGAGGRFSLGNRVWNDANNNGLVESGEAGVANVTLHLLRDDVDTGMTTTTDATGAYQFAGLAASDGYQVCFDLPSGFVGSNGQGQATSDRTDLSGADPNNYVDDDDNGRTRNGQQCSGYIILSDRLSSNQRVDFGLFAA